MINIDNKFDIGQIVYLRTDKEQLPRIITEIVVTKGELIYGVYAGTIYSKHYDYEMTSDVNTLITL